MSATLPEAGYMVSKIIICHHKRKINAKKRRQAYPLVEASFLTELCYVGLVVVGEHVVAHDGISHFGSLQQVDFEKPSLKRAFLGFIALEYVQQERGGFLDHVPVQEHIDDLYNSMMK